MHGILYMYVCVLMGVGLEVPYSRNLSWVKTFMNFAVRGQFEKVITPKISLNMVCHY